MKASRLQTGLASERWMRLLPIGRVSLIFNHPERLKHQAISYKKCFTPKGFSTLRLLYHAVPEKEV